MFNSRAKGNKFERQVSILMHRIICCAIGESPDCPLIVRRRTTTVTPDDDFKGAGDLQIAKGAASKLAEMHNFLPCVECKALSSVTLSSLLAPNKAVLSAWRQARGQANRASDREGGFPHVPIVAFAIKRVGIAIVTESGVWDRLYTPQEECGVRCIVAAYDMAFPDAYMYSTLAVCEVPK